MKTDIVVSVIIVNWNTRQITCNCLRSVCDQTSDVSFEVVLVDNASSDDSVEVIKKEFPQVVLIENSENRGFAAANNQGIEIASGKYVLLLNSDTVVLDHAIEKTVAFAEQCQEAGVVGCRVLNSDLSLQPTCYMFPSILNQLLFITYLYEMFSKSRICGRHRMTWWPHDEVKDVEVVTGCFMLVRRETIEQVGMMDERFFMYSEEVDWCYRIKQAGWKNLFTPDAEIVHLGGASAGRYGARRAEMIDKSYVRYLFKHWPAWKAKFGVFLMMLFYLSRMVIVLPFYIAGKKEKVFENHLAGFKGLMKYKSYLNDDIAL